MKIESVATAKTAELVAFYNSHNPEKLIKKLTNSGFRASSGV